MVGKARNDLPTWTGSYFGSAVKEASQPLRHMGWRKADELSQEWTENPKVDS